MTPAHDRVSIPPYLHILGGFWYSSTDSTTCSPHSANNAVVSKRR